VSAPGTFFCIYKGRDYPDDQRSLEHIVPYSIGGTGDFGTRDVSVLGNREVGSIVDSLLVNHPFLTVDRWRLQIKSQAGIIPGIEFPGTIDIDGHTLRVEYTVNPDGSCDLRTLPTVKSDWSAGSFSINCDPRDLPRILADLEKKGGKKGIPVNAQTIKIQSSRQVRVENPTISHDLVVPLFDLMPGFVKMALGTGHLVFGEAWSRGPEADLMRAVINERDPEKRKQVPIHGQVWPYSGNLAPLKQSFQVSEDVHVLAVINNRPPVFYALLFGKYDGAVYFGQQVLKGTALPPGKGVVFVIDCRTRQLGRYDYEEYITRQAMEKNWL
jgi:hypothetical protein